MYTRVLEVMLHQCISMLARVLKSVFSSDHAVLLACSTLKHCQYILRINHLDMKYYTNLNMYLFQQLIQLNGSVPYVPWWLFIHQAHYDNIIMSAMAFQITSLAIVYSTGYSGTDQRIHQSSASLAIVCGIHRWQVNSSHKRAVTRKMFPFHDVIMS